MVDLEPNRGVDRLVFLDSERGAAEGDAERPVAAAVEAEARVLALLPHRPHVADLGRGNHQPHPRVAHPERAQLAQFLGQVEPEPDPADHRVDPLGPPQVLGSQQRARVGRERGLERLDVFGADRETRGRPVPSKALQVLGASLQCRQQVEAGDATPTPPPHPLFIEGDHDHGPVVALDQPRGDDPNHAGMPTLAGEDVAGRLAQLGAQLAHRRLSPGVDLSLGRPALGVGPAQLDRDLLRPLRVLGQHQLDPGVGPIQPPRRVDPRRQFEGQVALVHSRRLAFRGRNQGLDPWPLGPPDLRQAPLDQRPVLPHERHHVSHRRQRHQIKIQVHLGGGIPGNTLPSSSRGSHPRVQPQRLTQLPSHGRPTQRHKRVLADFRVQDRALGQLVPGLVMVGDDHLHPQLLRLPHLIDRGDPAVNGDQKLGPARRKSLDVLRAQPVTVGDPVRDQPVAVGPEAAQGRDHHRGGTDAVDVEVAVNGDPAAGVDRGPDLRHDPVHALEGGGGM
ncbi:MAG TPA: hypothetical protein VHR18_01010 [Solirubrobacterales bacterium]|nr:hypothetical protein [Solirubrobacterales bacterium]